MNSTKTIICIFLCLNLYLPSTGYTDVAELTHSKSRSLRNIGTNIGIFIDSTGNHSIDEIELIFNKGLFDKSDKEILSFSMDEPIVWLQLPSTILDEEYLLIGNEVDVWTAELYIPDSTGNYFKYLNYDHFDLKNKHERILPYSSLGIAMPRANYKPTLPIFLRLRAKNSRNYIVKAGSKNSTINYLRNKETSALVFIAFMIGIFIYNSFLLFSTKNIVYAPYLLYLLYIIFAIPFRNGFAIYNSQWLLENDLLWAGLSYLTTAPFAIMYLDLKKNAPFAKRWIIGLATLMGLLIPISVTFDWISVESILPLLFLGSLIYNLSLFGSGIFVWIRGFKNARFYVLGWFFVLASLIVLILAMTGILPYNIYTENIIYAGFASEAILFAFALGDKLNTLEKERKAFQLKQVNLVENQNKLLAEQAYINSHLLRAPISRALGLVNLLKLDHLSPEQRQLVEHLDQSTHEMDELTIRVANILESDGYYEQYGSDQILNQ